MFLSDNTPMRKMALRAGMSVQTTDGESYAARELLYASAQELTRWFLEESLEHSRYVSALGLAWWGPLADRAASATRKRIKALAPTV
jgi:hypothetical protein